jgi:hypothetical protein
VYKKISRQDQNPLAVVGVGLEDQPNNLMIGNISEKPSALGVLWRISSGSVGFLPIEMEKREFFFFGKREKGF